MKSIREIGLKITTAQREYSHYTGDSADLERRGAGTSRPDLAWIHRYVEQKKQTVPDCPSSAVPADHSNQ